LLFGGSLSAGAQEIKFWTLTFDKIIKDFEAGNPGGDQRSRERSSRSESGRRRTAEIYRRPKITAPRASRPFRRPAILLERS
jgi:hypothetical protein